MKGHGASATQLLLLLALGSSALAANVVQMTISKTNPQIDIYRQDLGKDAFAKASVTENLFNNITGGSYMADVLVGTPAQNLSLVIDTGSSDTFLLSVTADECTDAYIAEQDGPCVGGTYDSTASSTYKLVGEGEFDIQYVDQSGSEGDYFTDTFSIGGVTVSGLQMGLALQTTVGVGIMGIGYTEGESVPSRERYPNLIDQMVSQKLINLKAYSLWLNDKEATTGSVLFGGIDTAKFIGTLKMLPTQTEDGESVIRSFVVLLTSLSLTEESGTTSSLTNSTSSLPVILDSGTTITYLPSNIVDNIVEKLGAVDDSNLSGFIFVDCDWRVTRQNEYISFGFGGTSGPIINVPLSEVIRTLQGSYYSSPFENTCALGIRSSDTTYLLGDTFLRSAYVVYDIDHNQIALAQTNFETTDSNVQEIPSSATGIPLLTGKASGVTKVPQSYYTSTGSGSGSAAVETSAGPIYTSLAGPGDIVPTDPTVTGGGFGGPTPTGGAGGAGSTSPPQPKSAAIGTVPAFEKGSLFVISISLMFALAGGSWFLA